MSIIPPFLTRREAFHTALAAGGSALAAEANADAPKTKPDPLDAEVAEFRRDVALGAWTAVKEYLGKLPADDGTAGYKHLLESLGSDADRSGEPMQPQIAQFGPKNWFRADDLVGLAAADALASTMAGSTEPTAWTDDTAMALCLAESLLTCGEFQPRDQLERYTRCEDCSEVRGYPYKRGSDGWRC